MAGGGARSPHILRQVSWPIVHLVVDLALMNIPCVPSASELSTVLRGACPSEGPGRKMFLLVDGERVSDRTENPPDDSMRNAPGGTAVPAELA